MMFAEQKGARMDTKTEGTLAVIASILVLFSAMWDPPLSAAVSVLALLGFGVYKFVQNIIK
jgi:hypothetical protein